jgi:glycopeptide antibiotics resistance protein
VTILFWQACLTSTVKAYAVARTQERRQKPLLQVTSLFMFILVYTILIWLTALTSNIKAHAFTRTHKGRQNSLL